MQIGGLAVPEVVAQSLNGANGKKGLQSMGAVTKAQVVVDKDGFRIRIRVDAFKTSGCRIDATSRRRRQLAVVPLALGVDPRRHPSAGS